MIRSQEFEGVRSQKSGARINIATRYAGGFFIFFLLTRGAKATTDEAGAAMPNTRGPFRPTDEPREAMVNINYSDS